MSSFSSRKTKMFQWVKGSNSSLPTGMQQFLCLRYLSSPPPPNFLVLEKGWAPLERERDMGKRRGRDRFNFLSLGFKRNIWGRTRHHWARTGHTHFCQESPLSNLNHFIFRVRIREPVILVYYHTRSIIVIRQCLWFWNGLIEAFQFNSIQFFISIHTEQYNFYCFPFYLCH